MKIHDVEQGSPEWHALRLGIPTASRFSVLMTAEGSRAKGKGVDTYLSELVAEWALGSPLESFSSSVTDRGNDLEAEAATWYAATTGAEVQEVGFCTTYEGRIGASPDRLVAPDGLLEIKCPMAKAMVGYILDPSSLVRAYYGQIQGQLYVTGREWCDVIAYNTTLPCVVQRVEPDDEWLAELDGALMAFLGRIDKAREKIDALRAEQAEAREKFDAELEADLAALALFGE